MARTWTPRDPEPTDAVAVVDTLGAIYVRRASGAWFVPGDPVTEYAWPQQWDGYGGDRDVAIHELTENDLYDLTADQDVALSERELAALLAAILDEPDAELYHRWDPDELAGHLARALHARGFRAAHRIEAGS